MLTLSKPPPRPDRTCPETELLTEVDRLLRAGRAGEAVEAIGLSYLPWPRTANALAVCHLRLKNTARALNLLRHIATDGAGLRPDAPTVFKTNLATALLVAGDVDGCLRTLNEIGDERRPSVRRLRAAVARAVSRTAWGRCLRRLGVRAPRSPVIDGPLGELWAEPQMPDGRDGSAVGPASVTGNVAPAAAGAHSPYSPAPPFRPCAAADAVAADRAAVVEMKSRGPGRLERTRVGREGRRAWPLRPLSPRTARWNGPG